MREKVNAHDNFDQFAHTYRDLHTENVKLSGADSEYFSEFKAKDLARIKPVKAVDILDLGCGDGTMGKFLVKHMAGCRLSGIDISEESVVVAQERGLEKAEFRPYDGTTIPYPDAQFDICTIATVLHHIDHALHPALMLEVNRVLKPGARIYIYEHNPYNPVTRHMVDTCPFDADAVLLTPGYSKGLLRQAGFSKVTNRFVLFMPRGGVFKALLWMEKLLEWLPVGGQFITRGVKG